MANLLSNELKAVVILEDLIETPDNILKENCLTVQKLNYDCVRKRNQKGIVYGATNPVLMTFTVRVNRNPQATKFFKAVLSNLTVDFSFLFNATYDNNLRLKDYDEGMVVNGYVVGVEEVYKTDPNANGQTDQMLLNVTLLVCSVTYLGSNSDSNLKGIFIYN